MTDVRIVVDTQQISGKLLTPETTAVAHPALLFVHGWGGSQRRDIAKAKQLVPRGYACLTFNLRGHARTRRQFERVTRVSRLSGRATRRRRRADLGGRQQLRRLSRRLADGGTERPRPGAPRARGPQGRRTSTPIFLRTAACGFPRQRIVSLPRPRALPAMSWWWSPNTTRSFRTRSSRTICARSPSLQAR